MAEEVQKINFSKHWDKLDKKQFTTIRGKSHPERHRLNAGDIVLITVKRRPLFYAQIIRFEKKKIRDIDLELIKEDVRYMGNAVESHEEFVEKLRRVSPRYSNFTMDSIVTIYYLKKLKNADNPITNINGNTTVIDFSRISAGIEKKKIIDMINGAIEMLVRIKKAVNNLGNGS